jgi:hypothetical protein
MKISARDQRQFGQCLLAVTEKAEGRQCLDQFRGVDLLGKEAGPKVCAGIDQLLQCMAKMVEMKMGKLEFKINGENIFGENGIVE